MLDYNNNPIANAFTSMRIDGESLICPVPPVEIHIQLKKSCLDLHFYFYFSGTKLYKSNIQYSKICKLV